MKSKSLFWSTNTPIVRGWYFFRKGGRVDVCRVYQDDIDYRAFLEDTEWAGPLQEPVDKS